MSLIKSSIFILILSLLAIEPAVGWTKFHREADGNFANNFPREDNPGFIKSHSVQRRDTSDSNNGSSDPSNQTQAAPPTPTPIQPLESPQQENQQPQQQENQQPQQQPQDYPQEQYSGPQFEPPPNGSAGIGTAVTKSESDQQQIQETGNKNVQEIIPMGRDGFPNGHRHEQSTFQKQTSSQRTKSETMAPVAIGTFAPFAHMPQMGPMPAMAAMPMLPPLQSLAPMPPMPEMSRMIRDVSVQQTEVDLTNPDRHIPNGAKGTGAFTVEEDTKNRNLEKRERLITNEMPVSHAQSPHAVFITGPEIDDAHKG